MHHLSIILRREYVERVRSKSFLLSTILTPLFMSLFALGPSLSARLQGSGSYHFSVVDESETLGPQVVEAINSAAEGDGDGISADGGLSPTRDLREALDLHVANGEIAGYLWIPADVMTSNRAELRVGEEVPGLVRGTIADAVSSAARLARLTRAGVPPAEVGALFQPVNVEVALVAPGGDAEVTSEGGLIVSLLMGFLLYFLILLYGSQVMHSVQEEKTSRIAEVLVSSVNPAELMLGKVLGVGGAALTQVAIWIAFSIAVFGAGDTLVRMGLPREALEIFESGIDPLVVASGFGYLILGFFLYATLFAAVGAAAASTEDAQRFTFPIILPLFVPMFLAETIVNAPEGTAAGVLSWVPLTAPLVMPMRMGAGGGSTPETLGSLALLVAAVIAVGWVAGKIYRVGILSTGTRPSLRDLARWVRMA